MAPPWSQSAAHSVSPGSCCHRCAGSDRPMARWTMTANDRNRANRQPGRRQRQRMSRRQGRRNEAPYSASAHCTVFARSSRTHPVGRAATDSRAPAVDGDARQVEDARSMNTGVSLFGAEGGECRPPDSRWRFATSGLQGATAWRRSGAPGSWWRPAVAMHEHDQRPGVLVRITRVFTHHVLIQPQLARTRTLPPCSR